MITCDETWIHQWYSETNRTMQWKNSGSPATKKFLTPLLAGNIKAMVF
jgi:hypothetical protein